MAPLSHRTIISTLDFLLLLCLSVFSVQAAAHSAAQSQRRPHAAHLLQLPGVTLPVPVLRLQQVTKYNHSSTVLKFISEVFGLLLCYVSEANIVPQNIKIHPEGNINEYTYNFEDGF